MNFKSYEEVDLEVTRLYNEGSFEEAISLLETVIDKYPENLYTITWDLAVFYSMSTPQQIEKSIDTLDFGYERGLFYSIDPESKLWESFKESTRFLELVAKNKARKEQAQAIAKPKYEVYLPENYSEEKSYPLHIAIHGWGEDVPFYRKFWRSNMLNKEYIALFVQSSRVTSSTGFCWDDIDLAREEIKAAYDQVIAQYSIDHSNITVGGFSQGGTMAIDFGLNGLIPLKGFIALCPDKPSIFSKEGVEFMKEKHISGIILTGEKDGALPQQKQMVDLFEENGFSHQFIINENLGHWFPESLPEQLDEALNYIDSEV